jgi:hypothetical protein
MDGLLNGLAFSHGVISARRLPDDTYGCFGARGLIVATESWRQTVITPDNDPDFIERERRDTSAFAAARTFMRYVSDADVRAAIDRAILEKMNMDPDANFQQQQDLAKQIIADNQNPRATVNVEDAVQLAELVLALTEWAQRGGFSPSVFKPK